MVTHSQMYVSVDLVYKFDITSHNQVIASQFGYDWFGLMILN